jgi:transcriptional regulator with XRE-family HTH domain
MTQIEIDPEKLRQARYDAGYSLRELAAELGVDHNVIWLYEHGRRNPQPRTLRKLAEVLGTEVRDLRAGEDD